MHSELGLINFLYTGISRNSQFCCNVMQTIFSERALSLGFRRMSPIKTMSLSQK